MNRIARTKSHLDYLWRASLACFVTAGLTGFLYRMGMLGWLPTVLGLSLENVRHAHSHLMFFGWAVPLPLCILLHRIRSEHEKHRAAITWMTYALAGALSFGILAYPFFLIYGYHPVQIGAAALPLSVMLSGLVMICWYVFLGEYLQLRKNWQPGYSQPWIDGALLLLFVCSLGAWGVAVLQAVDPGNQLFMKSLTHFFLATFTEGWVVLVLMAILVDKLQLKPNDWLWGENLALGCIAIGAPLTFPYGISESLLSPTLLAVARIGGGIAALGLIMFVHATYRSGKWRRHARRWGWPVGLLGFKALMQLVASVAPASFWLSDHGLRIFYLHVLLLGALTLTMSSWLQERSSASLRYYRLVVAAVLVVLLSLILPTQFWPGAWSGVWVFYVLAFAALLPVLAMAIQWWKLETLQNQRY